MNKKMLEFEEQLNDMLEIPEVCDWETASDAVEECIAVLYQLHSDPSKEKRRLPFDDDKICGRVFHALCHFASERLEIPELALIFNESTFEWPDFTSSKSTRPDWHFTEDIAQSIRVCMKEAFSGWELGLVEQQHDEVKNLVRRNPISRYHTVWFKPRCPSESPPYLDDVVRYMLSAIGLREPKVTCTSDWFDVESCRNHQMSHHYLLMKDKDDTLTRVSLFFDFEPSHCMIPSNCLTLSSESIEESPCKF